MGLLVGCLDEIFIFQNVPKIAEEKIHWATHHPIILNKSAEVFTCGVKLVNWGVLPTSSKANRSFTLRTPSAVSINQH